MTDDKGKLSRVSVLGHIVTCYSQLEWIVGMFIALLLNPDDRVGHTITAGMPISQKLTLLSNLFRLLAECEPGTDVAAPDRAVASADRAVEARNAVTHALWWPDDEDDDAPGRDSWPWRMVAGAAADFSTAVSRRWQS
jgi:hypothetical protein